MSVTFNLSMTLT